jgi:hypothetical protein
MLLIDTTNQPINQFDSSRHRSANQSKLICMDKKKRVKSQRLNVNHNKQYELTTTHIAIAHEVQVSLCNFDHHALHLEFTDGLKGFSSNSTKINMGVKCSRHV